MGIIKGGLLVIVSVLLFLSILLTGIFWTFSLSLQYDNVEEEAVSVGREIIEQSSLDSQIQQISGQVETYCETGNESDFVINQGGYTIDVSCETAEQGSEAVINETISDITEGVYYDEYNCKFLNCIQESDIPLVLLSEKSKDYWQEKFYYTLLISVILLIPAFLFIEKKSGLPILAGSLIIIASLPLLGIEKLLSYLPENAVLSILEIFFTQSGSVFTKMIIIGILVLVIGIIFKLFKVGFKIREFFDKIKNSKGKDKKKESKEIKNQPKNPK